LGIFGNSSERDVVAHRQVDTACGLEDHRDVAVFRLEGVDHPFADAQLAPADRFQAGDHPQRGRLATAGRSDQDQEFAVVDIQRQIGDGLKAVLIDLVDTVERDRCHRTPIYVG
jgi:hypothetical protein